MKPKYWFTIALLLTAFSFTLQAGVIDLYGRPWTGIGDAADGQGTYYNVQGFASDPAPGTSTQTVVGGQYDAALSRTQPVATLETDLGLGLGQVSGLDATLGVVNGSAVYYSNVFAKAGDILCIAVNFVANDALPYDDFAFFSAVSNSDEAPISYIEMLGRIDDSQPGGVGDFWSSGYHTFNYTFTAEGTYTLGFGVVNGVQLAVLPIDDPSAAESDSALLLDSAPEPSSWLLAGSAILGVFLLRRRGMARSR
jgi:hypothetical protein